MGRIKVVPISLMGLALAACSGGLDLATQALPGEPSFQNSSEPASFNLDVVLHGSEAAAGAIKFRQPAERHQLVNLVASVSGLAPNTSYLLQRATDAILDRICTGTNWLTLGLGPSPQSIVTNGEGRGQATFWRALPTTPIGSVFDIHFQIVDAATQAVVLSSPCYQFRVR